VNLTIKSMKRPEKRTKCPFSVANSHSEYTRGHRPSRRALKSLHINPCLTAAREQSWPKQGALHAKFFSERKGSQPLGGNILVESADVARDESRPRTNYVGIFVDLMIRDPLWLKNSRWREL